MDISNHLKICRQKCTLKDAQTGAQLHNTLTDGTPHIPYDGLKGGEGGCRKEKRGQTFNEASELSTE
eukprot:9155588-Pyramimonas_sp.AAC.2